MVTVWEGNEYNPYDTTVYDARYRRKTFMKHLRRLKTEPRKVQMKRLEELKKNGFFDDF